MKIYSEYKPNESGKGKFLSRLFPELEKLGCHVQYEPKGAHARLALTRMRTKSNLPTVLRVDGIHLEQTKKTIWNNNRVKDSIKKANAVIYQSNFSKDMVEKILGVKHPFASVIYNGADPKEFPPSANRPFDFIMVARWANRKHKRLMDMLKIAEITPELSFVVCGEIDHDVIKAPNISYTGQVGNDELKYLLSQSKMMLNLAEYDWCPNAVVEALVAGLSVICLEGTGIGEIVGDCGIQLCRGEIFSPRRAAKGRFCKISHKEISTILLRITKGCWDYLSPIKHSQIERILIQNTASQYYNVFRSVICGH